MSALTNLPLIDANDVYTVLGSDPDLMAAVVASTESAILRAALKVQRTLDTNLAPLFNTDIFFVDESLMPINRRYRLRLKNGLVRRDVPITIQWSSILNDPNFGEDEWADVAQATMDYDKGIVQVPKSDDKSSSGTRWVRSDSLPRTEFYVKVTYASGLCAEVDKPSNFEELRQAMICYVPLLMLSTSNAAEATPKAMYALQERASNLDDQADDMLFRYMRHVSPVVRPYDHSDAPLDSTQIT